MPNRRIYLLISSFTLLLLVLVSGLFIYLRYQDPTGTPLRDINDLISKENESDEKIIFENSNDMDHEIMKGDLSAIERYILKNTYDRLVVRLIPEELSTNKVIGSDGQVAGAFQADKVASGLDVRIYLSPGILDSDGSGSRLASFFVLKALNYGIPFTSRDSNPDDKIIELLDSIKNENGEYPVVIREKQ